jgi:hypothetical protein
VPVNGGGKVTGSIDGFELGAMDVETRNSGPNPLANYAVARVKRSLWGGSYIGVMGIDKRSGNPLDSFNQTGGADTRLVFHKDLVLTGYATETRTPGISSGQTDLGAGLVYQNSWFEGFAQHRRVGPNFNPEVGFLERNDCICDYADVTFKPRPKLRGVRELNFEGFIFHAPDTNNVLLTQEWQGTFRIEFNNGAYSDDDIVDVFTQRLTTPFNIYKNIFIPVGEYHWTRHQFTYGSPQDRRLMVRLFERFGTYYNGHLNEARIRANYRANERLSFSFAEQWNRFRLGVVTDPAGNLLPSSAGNFSVVFGSFQTNYSFSRFLELSTLLRMDTANTQAASANIHLRWNYRPDSDLFLSIQQANVLPAWSPQTRPNSTKIALPSSSHTPGVREVVMKWITRKDIKVDRVACPWLIKRFVDPQAEFLFVEEKDLLQQAKLHDAIPFDAPRIAAIKLNHRGSRCSFEAILEDYAVSDPALQKLALIVRAADVKGQVSAAPEGIGLRSIAQGFAALGISDEERLLRQFPVYDALYAYVQGK